MLSLYFITPSIWAEEAVGLYTNGQWDPACSQCWPSPRTAENNRCTPKDCAVQGYYHCQQQDPPLAIDDDPRLVSLIKSGQCTYVPRVALNEGEAAYIHSMQLCTTILDKMAGRFISPVDSHDASKMKVDFYLTHFKANILGSAHAKLKLAIDYDNGIGTQQDRSKATELYRKAALKGFPFAQYAIGARYAYGISMPKDKDKAIMWLKKALDNRPITEADKKAQAIVTPCAIKLIERLTPI
ncbi:MAG: sel1 repeat family protein [Gammaproteobacteria bacterium]|nr:sel1 repeat family protein [Gammaproteobacteria bacterium]